MPTKCHFLAEVSHCLLAKIECELAVRVYPAIIIIIIILVITFMHGIYNYVPETSHVSRVYRVATILYLEFVLHVM